MPQGGAFTVSQLEGQISSAQLLALLGDTSTTTADLTTDDQSSPIAAINEVDANTDANTAAIDSLVAGLNPGAFVYRGNVESGNDLTSGSTGNTDLDSLTDYTTGDVFFVNSTGTLTFSDTTLAVTQGDNIYFKADAAKASVATTDVNLVDSTDLVQSVNGQVAAVSLDTDDISEGAAQYFTEARVLGTVLAGFSSGSGAVAATDSILQLAQKLNGNIQLLRDLVGIAFPSANHGTAAGPRVADNATTDAVVRALTPQLNEDWGTAFPATTWPGRRFTRTDIDGSVTFEWDDGRSKWLGELEMIEIGEPGDNDRIHFGRAEISNLATDGSKLPYDAVITRTFAANRSNQNETMTLTIYQDSVTSYTVDWAGTAFADTGPIDIPWNAGVLLNGRIASTSGNFNRLIGQIHYRRVAT